MSENKKFVAIKVKKGIYDSIIELKKVLIQNGYNSFPKEFLAFLEKDDFDITKITMGNMLKLANNAILYLFREEGEL